MDSNKRKGMLLLVSGPSGTGKGTLIDRVRAIYPDIAFSVSVTTRALRDGEVQGKHYISVSDETFDAYLAKDMFLEHATVHGHRYGTPAAPIEQAIEQGRCILLDIDSQGALNVMKKGKDIVSVFILPPSYAALETRLITRNTENPGEIARRLSAARKELAYAHHYQYALTNADLDDAIKDFCHIIEAERMKTSRFLPEIPEQ